MQLVVDDIKNLFRSHNNTDVQSIEKLPQSGGDRVYFRVRTKEQFFIATYNKNIQENKTFLNFTKHFKKTSCPVPEIYLVNNEQTIYIQEDFGMILY